MYYLFAAAKIFILLIFIFRMYRAISALNKLKISFEEYSKSKRGLILALLAIAIACSNGWQIMFFRDYAVNTTNTLALSTTLMNRHADLKYAEAFLLETIY